MNYANKNVTFLVSSGPNSDGYINFYNTDMITSVSRNGRYLHLFIWDCYSATADCTTTENAKHNLPLVLDAISTSFDENPKAILKLNEIEGVKGMDGVLIDSYNSDLPLDEAVVTTP